MPQLTKEKRETIRSMIRAGNDNKAIIEAIGGVCSEGIIEYYRQTQARYEERLKRRRSAGDPTKRPLKEEREKPGSKIRHQLLDPPPSASAIAASTEILIRLRNYHAARVVTLNRVIDELDRTDRTDLPAPLK